MGAMMGSSKYNLLSPTLGQQDSNNSLLPAVGGIMGFIIG
jgi:hypothetical protein